MRLRAARVVAPRPLGRSAVVTRMAFDMEALIQKSKDDRLKHLEEQAMNSIKIAVRSFLCEKKLISCSALSRC